MYRYRLFALCLALSSALAPATAPAAGWYSRIGNGLGDGRDMAMRMTTTGTVSAIDAVNRLMAVKVPSGTMVFRLDPRVPNVDRIQAGGQVRVDYVGGFVLSLKRSPLVLRPVPPPAATEAAGQLADDYEVPHTWVSHVEAVDKDNLLLRLKAPGGQVSDYPVQDRSALAGVRAGDQILVSMNQAVAVEVTILP